MCVCLCLIYAPQLFCLQTYTSHKYIQMHTYVQMHVSICTYVCMSVSYICTSIVLPTNIYKTQIYTDAYVCTYACVYLYKCVYVCVLYMHLNCFAYKHIQDTNIYRCIRMHICMCLFVHICLCHIHINVPNFCQWDLQFVPLINGTNDKSHENPCAHVTKFQVFRQNSKILCHPICNRLYLTKIHTDAYVCTYACVYPYV